MPASAAATRARRATVEWKKTLHTVWSVNDGESEYPPGTRHGGFPDFLFFLLIFLITYWPMADRAIIDEPDGIIYEPENDSFATIVRKLVIDGMASQLPSSQQAMPSITTFLTHLPPHLQN